MTHRVDIAIACGPVQYSAWWANVLTALLREVGTGQVEIGQIMAISSAVPDYNKNNMVGGGIQLAETGETPLASVEEKKRNRLTDANRGAAASRFLAGTPSGWKADWLFWLDDDTVPPADALSRLLALDKPACAGLYFNTNPPKNPIAYVKDPRGFGYQALYDYPPGACMEVDSVGMGCTLVHRDVFEKIQAAHRVYSRPNGSLIPIHKSRVHDRAPDFGALRKKDRQDVMVLGGWMCQCMADPAPDDNRAWPFFALEYGRTEDHHFWELAAAVGVRPWVDTTILCGHIKPAQTCYEDYRKALLNGKGISAG